MNLEYPCRPLPGFVAPAECYAADGKTLLATGRGFPAFSRTDGAYISYDWTPEDWDDDPF